MQNAIYSYTNQNDRVNYTYLCNDLRNLRQMAFPTEATKCCDTFTTVRT